MTNIRSEEMFPSDLPDALKYPSVKSLAMLFDLRTKTYRGFANVEKDKGLLKPEMSFSTPEGQEAVRILTQRGLEELAEAYESQSRDHYLEELIDAINYFWSLATLDPKTPLTQIIEIMVKASLEVTDYDNLRLVPHQIGMTVIELNNVFEKLRHRAWMSNPQSPYFDGWKEIAYFLAFNLRMILSSFNDWQEFVAFFIAKDNVLQFRINTKY